MGIGGTMDVISGKLTRLRRYGRNSVSNGCTEPSRSRGAGAGYQLPEFAFYVVLTALHLDPYNPNDSEEESEII